MPFIKDFSETNDFLKDLSPPVKQLILSNINLMVLDHLEEQGNVNIFTVFKKLSELLTEDHQKQLLHNVAATVINYLIREGNVDLFSIVENLDNLLNPEHHQQLLSDVGKVLDNYSQSVKKAAKAPSSLVDSEHGNNIMQIIHASILKRKSDSGKDETDGDEKIIQVSDFDDKPRAINNIVFVPVSEGLKNIIPRQNNFNPEKLMHASLAPDSFNILNLVTSGKSLWEIYEEYHAINTQENILEFIDNMTELCLKGFITFFRGNNLPPDKEIRTKLGDILTFLGFVNEKQLGEALFIQKTWHNKDVSHDEYPRPRREYLGELLVKLEVLSVKQLKQALAFKTWYHTIINLI